MFGNIFLGYAAHVAELDCLTNMIIEQFEQGNIDFIQDCIDELTLSDLEYIEARLKKFGFVVTLTLN